MSPLNGGSTTHMQLAAALVGGAIGAALCAWRVHVMRRKLEALQTQLTQQVAQCVRM